MTALATALAKIYALQTTRHPERHIYWSDKFTTLDMFALRDEIARLRDERNSQ